MKTINIHRLQLQFDGDQVTGGSAFDQAMDAVSLINQTLQREPYGLGAQLIAYTDEIEVEENWCDTENDLSPQAAVVAKLESKGFRFSNWIPACPDAHNQPSDSDPRMTAVMIKPRPHGREYREVEPDGTVN